MILLQNCKTSLNTTPLQHPHHHFFCQKKTDLIKMIAKNWRVGREKVRTHATGDFRARTIYVRTFCCIIEAVYFFYYSMLVCVSCFSVLDDCIINNNPQSRYDQMYIYIYIYHSNTQIDTINNACGCYFFVRGVRTSRSFCVLNHSFDVVIIVGKITKLVSNCH